METKKIESIFNSIYNVMKSISALNTNHLLFSDSYIRVNNCDNLKRNVEIIEKECTIFQNCLDNLEQILPLMTTLAAQAQDRAGNIGELRYKYVGFLASLSVEDAILCQTDDETRQLATSFVSKSTQYLLDYKFFVEKKQMVVGAVNAIITDMQNHINLMKEMIKPDAKWPSSDDFVNPSLNIIKVVEEFFKNDGMYNVDD